MLETFIFSANAVVPIFIIIALGYLMKRTGYIDKRTIKKFNDIVFTFALPVMLFSNVAHSDFTQSFDLGLLAFTSSVTIISFIVIWIFAEIFMKNKSSIGAFVQGSFRGNYAILGLSVIANILGGTSSGKDALVTTFIIPIYSILSIIVLTMRSRVDHQGNSMLKYASINLIKNPLIIGIFIGLPFTIFEIPLPTIIDTSTQYLANIAMPLALLAIGAKINFKAPISELKWGFIATLIKIVILPVVSLFFAIEVFGYRGESLVIIFVMSGTCTAVSSYVMSSKMQSDENLAANIILLTTIGSLFTFTIGIYFLKLWNLI